jgi:hypothetical protein
MLTQKTMKQKNSLFINLYEDFLKSYRDYKTNRKQHSLDSCLDLLQPCFISWQKDFLLPSFNDNINILTLFSLLAKDNKPKGSFEFKLNSYKHFLNTNQLSFLDHLNEAFLMHMQKQTILYEAYPKDYKFLFYISQEIKYALFKIIRKILQFSKRDFFTNSSHLYIQPQVIIENHLSLEFYFIFHNNKLLYSILMSLIYEKNTWKNIKKKFNLNNQDYVLLKEEVNSWINIALSSN